MSQAQVTAGVLQGKGGRTALQAQIAGAREAKYGADYALASALSQRQQQDSQAVAEQKLELEKIRLQHSLDQQDQQGTQNPVFLKAQDQMTAILADPNTTYQQAQSAMRDAQIRGNLTPEQTASLQAQLDNAFPDKTGTSVLAGTPVDKDGNPLLLKPSDEQRQNVRTAVASAVDANQSQTEALTELRTLTKDTPMTPAARAALEEYFRMVWQTYAEVTRAMQGGGRGAVSQRGAQPRRPQPTPGPR